MKTVLILGSSGQIGSHLTNYLNLKKNYKILKFDIVNSKYEDLRINNNEKLKKLVKKSDFIFFLAFDVGGSVYLKKYQNSYNFLNNNISIMKNTFQAIYQYQKKFVFASSQMSNMNFSTYGVLKRIGEDMTKSIGGISVRFWNVYGIEKNLEKSHVITDFLLKGLKNRKINMLTDGNEKRDFLYAEDCCRGLEIIMNKFDKLKNNISIDLNYGIYTKIIDIAKVIKKIFKNYNINVKIIKGIQIDDVQRNKINVGNNLLNKFWKPQYSLEKGIEKILLYYLYDEKK
jgi:nucleoside-diphosphate-sugar epimerase